jgi:hypothetical protein
MEPAKSGAVPAPNSAFSFFFLTGCTESNEDRNTKAAQGNVHQAQRGNDRRKTCALRCAVKQLLKFFREHPEFHMPTAPQDEEEPQAV